MFISSATNNWFDFFCSSISTFYYFLMNKARGEVCSTVSDRRTTVYSHFPQELLVDANGAKLHSVGRLDADTQGLLLFTNDGKLSDFLTRPHNKIPKTYLVTLKNAVSDEEERRYCKSASEGLTLPPEKKAGEEKSAPACIEWLNKSQCKITVTEGKFHEVKRIFRALGNEVTELLRTGMADLELDLNLKSGQWRPLSEAEVEGLKNFCADTGAPF